MNKKIIGVGICMLMLAAVVFPTVRTANNNGFINEKTNTRNQTHITSHPATSEEIKQMEQHCGIFDPNKNYNIIYGCHGTGAAPPTEADYRSMIGSLQIVDTVSSNQPLPSLWDLSTDPCFPIVGNQSMQGSCCAWAATYYTTGYVIGKNLNWTQAHEGNITQLLSPAWTYNKCNQGYDSGSTVTDNMRVIQTVGCSRLCTMPYNISDPVSWGNESAWRDAPPYRVNKVYQINHNGSTINSIKTVVLGGHPVTFDLNASSYVNFGSDDVLGSSAMLSRINHAQTIVGYDDAKIDGETGETGAFKIVNSWGSSWGPDQNGYYWITYQAFLGDWNCDPLLYDDALYIDSQPTLLAIWNLNPACDKFARVELGIGLYEQPLATREPYWHYYSPIMHPYPSFMCLDVTEFFSIWRTPVDAFYFKIGQAWAQNGTITSFKMEYYRDGYNPGNPTSISNESPDVPKNTPCHVYVNFSYPNRPPNPPTITGPAEAKIKIAIDYNFTTTDPDDDNISYFIDWGDSTNSSLVGPYVSGTIITKSHTWTTKGTYIIKAKAKDTLGAESNWSTLSVTMPLSYEPPQHSFLLWLFDRFPNAFPILRHLLGY